MSGEIEGQELKLPLGAQTRRGAADYPTLHPFLESHILYFRSRFGAWKYEVGNMDHSFMQGVEVVERIFKGTQERTVKGQF